MSTDRRSFLGALFLGASSKALIAKPVVSTPVQGVRLTPNEVRAKSELNPLPDPDWLQKLRWSHGPAIVHFNNVYFSGADASPLSLALMRYHPNVTK